MPTSSPCPSLRFATDIDRAHEIMDEEGRRIPIIAKIEKPQALENLEEIVKTFDGVMAARGDMAVECPLEEVPLATKRIIELARQYAKPVIVATEVLGSMVNSPVPTRAEASDCANAILDGSDATMTSNETAVGKYPDVTVATMARISGYATDHGFDHIRELKNLDMSSTGAVSSAAVDLADKLNAKAIVAYTQTGATVHRVSSEASGRPDLRPDQQRAHLPLAGSCPGAPKPSCSGRTITTSPAKDLMVYTDKVLEDAGKVADGDKIVILSSAQGDHQPDRTDSHLRAHRWRLRLISVLLVAAGQLAYSRPAPSKVDGGFRPSVSCCDCVVIAMAHGHRGDRAWRSVVEMIEACRSSGAKWRPWSWHPQSCRLTTIS